MTVTNERSKFTIAALALWAALLTCVMGFTASFIEQSYLQNHSYFYDSVSYQFYNARLYTRIPDEGRLALAAREWLHNPKHPLRTIVPLLFAPGSLARPIAAHLATALPMLFAFLLLLGLTVYRRVHHLLYALGCMALFCAIPFLYDPVFGLGAFWLDLPASLLVGAATMCLLNSGGARDRKWLAAFAVFAALAMLSRYVAAVYTFVICAPILTYYLARVWRSERRWRSVLLPLVSIAVIIGAIAGRSIVAHYDYNIGFYSIYVYNIGFGIAESARFVLGSLWSSISSAGLVILAVIACINLVLLRRAGGRDFAASLLISMWLAIAVVLLLIFGIRDVGADHVTLYAVPLIFLAAVSPAPFVFNSEESLSASRSVLTPLAFTMIALAVVASGWSAMRNYERAAHPSPEARAQKAFDIALARSLAHEGGSLTWIGYFQEYAWIPTMEAFYNHEAFPLPAGGGFFEDHEALWRGHYPGLSPLEVSEQVYSATNRWVDVAVVLDDPTRIENNGYTDNDISRTVARRMSERIRADEKWRRVFAVESPRYGTLVGYRNSHSQGRGYDLALRNLAQIVAGTRDQGDK